MSSVQGSRDPSGSGDEPKIVPLGYSARVLYTFLPHEKENTEIFVSEGDIIQLQYKVGGWVYVRTEDGETGYIPANFCSQVKSDVPKTSQNLPQKSVRFSLPTDDKSASVNVRSSWEDVCITQTSFSSMSEEESDTTINKPGLQSSENKEIAQNVIAQSYIPNFTTLASKIPNENYGAGKKKDQMNADKADNAESVEVQSEETKYTQQTCDVCNGVLSRLNYKVQNLANTDQEKSDIGSRKLLNDLESATNEGLKLSFNLQTTIDRDKSNSRGLNQTDVSNNNDLDETILASLNDRCVQCAVVRNYVNSKGKNAMSGLQSSIRDLQLHAVSDSESESSETDSETSEDLKDSIRSDQGGDAEVPNTLNIRQSGEDLMKQISDDIPNQEIIVCNGLNKDIMKRSASLSLPGESDDTKQIIGRNKSFSIGSVDSSVTREGKLAWNDTDNNSPTCVQTRLSPPSYHEVFNSNGPCTKMTNERDSSIVSRKTVNGFTNGVASPCSMDSDTIQGDKKLVSSSKTGDSLTLQNGDKLGSHINCQTGSPDQQKLNSSAQERGRISNNCVLRQPKRVGDSSVNGVQKSHIDDDNMKTGEQMATSPSETINSPRIITNGTLTGMQINHRNRFQTLPNKMPFQMGSRLRQHNSVGCNGAIRMTSQEGNQPRILALPPPAGPFTLPRRTHATHAESKNADKQEESEIRKTLQEHSVMSMASRRTSQVPMRAHHSLNTGLFKDTQAPLKHTGRTILVKKFNKQMWRAPNGAPEGGESQRPFSPFGGTLPPSKITKKKVVEVFV